MSDHSMRTNNINQPEPTSHDSADKIKEKKVHESVSADEEQRFKKMLLPTQDELTLKNSLSQPAKDQAVITATLPGPAEIVPAASQKVSPANEALLQLIHAVVEKIAVTQDSSNSHQMLIQLKDSVLTHIVIDASNHQLIVQFVTASGNVDNWLKAQQTSITQELSDKLHRPVNLEFLYTEKETSSELGNAYR